MAEAGFPNEKLALGPEDFDLSALSSYPVVVGPVSFSREGATLYLPLTERKVGTAAFLAALKPGAILFAGTLPPGAAAPHVSCVDLTRDAELYRKNILPTCEGILQILLNKIDFTLNASKLLLLGYGRIAKTLARLLKNLGVDLAVYSAAPAEIDAFGRLYAPGGLDRAASAELGIDFLAAEGIPGTKAPRTVAKAMMEAILRRLA